jgi:hypothetical protein
MLTSQAEDLCKFVDEIRTKDTIFTRKPSRKKIKFGQLDIPPSKEALLKKLNIMLSTFDGILERANENTGHTHPAFNDIEIDQLAEIEMKLEITLTRVKRLWEQF